MKKLFMTFAAGLCIAMTAMVGTSCSDNDDQTAGSTAPEVAAQPVEDAIETRLKGDIALMGSNFDEMTERLLARVAGQTFHVEAGDTSLPSTVKTLLIDQTVWDAMNEGCLFQLYKFYQNGITICMHKPTDATALAVMLYLRWKEMGVDSVSSGDGKSSARQSIRRMAQTRAASSDAQSYDFIAVKKGGKSFQIQDIYTPDTTYTTTEHITTVTENGDSIGSDTVITYPAVKPTPYQYGLFAEEAVEWMNETEEETRTRATRAVGDNSYEPLQTFVVNVSSTVVNKYTTGFFNQNEHSESTSFSAPMIISVWVNMMYNFDRDEDYYSVVVTEDYDAGKNYLGEYFRKGGKEGSCATGIAWRDLEMRARWPHSSDNPVRLQYDILPQGKASPVVSTEIQGWSANADISIGMDGVAVKPGIKYLSEKIVTSIEADVTLTNRKDIDGNWMSWKYDFGHQPYYKDLYWGHKVFKGYQPPTNATCRSHSVQNQAWKWLVPNTKRRGETPFTFTLKIASMQRTNAWGLKKWSVDASKTGNGAAQMDLSEKEFTIDLPVPQRYKHIYSLTTDEIGDLTEFNNLMVALRDVSTNFNSLYKKLIRLDSDGNPLGRTGVTETALKRMVGQEWYALAREVLGKKIAVTKTYKFYVKDETGAKLSMINYTYGDQKSYEYDYDEEGEIEMVYPVIIHGPMYKDMGTYLVIGPDGITIE